MIVISEKYPNKGHHIFADWFDASVLLVEELEVRQIWYTGYTG